MRTIKNGEIKKIGGRYFRLSKIGSSNELDQNGSRLKSVHTVLWNREKDRYELWTGVSIKSRKR